MAFQHPVLRDDAAIDQRRASEGLRHFLQMWRMIGIKAPRHRQHRRRAIKALREQQRRDRRTGRQGRKIWRRSAPPASSNWAPPAVNSRASVSALRASRHPG